MAVAANIIDDTPVICSATMNDERNPDGNPHPAHRRQCLARGFFPSLERLAMVGARGGGAVAVSAWLILALATIVGLVHLGVMLELAALVGVLTPPLLVIVAQPRGGVSTAPVATGET